MAHATATVGKTAYETTIHTGRHTWPLETVLVDATLSRAADKSASIDRVLKFDGALSDEQLSRLAEIAERTPVTLALKSGVEIRTTIARPS